MTKSTPPARLHFLLARRAPIGVIFRRGPSKWTQLIKWNTDTDSFEPGQWFRGRLYERRCDLSPDGTRLVYFVSKINERTLKDDEYTYAWTAVSNPPHLTALALWPKGDCWHGGGLFRSDKELFLNHKPEVAKPHRSHKPRHLQVESNPDASGEDDPLYSMRLKRDGWKLTQELQGRRRGWSYDTLQPELRYKHRSTGHLSLIMERSVVGNSPRDRYFVASGDSGGRQLLDGVSQADWDQAGRVVTVRGGKLFAVEIDGESAPVFHELADFNANRPENLVAPH